MITLYTAATPNGQKAAIMLHEADLPHTVRAIDLGKGEQHVPEFVALSPNHKIPVIVDSDTGQVIFESGAILIYLADKSGLFLAADPAKRSVALQWLFMQVGHVGPMLGQLWWFRHGTKEPNAQALERYTRETIRLYGVIERRLGEARFIAGEEYSIADIAMFPWLRTHEELGIEIDTYPHLKAWLEQIGSRPAVVQGLRVPEPAHCA
ncbi:MAG: glutathione S-transferase N-terminal domain-containing protein [Burkholderiaceae bacterium]|nr:glutathione S-transferase N-terminal domain-containing protein [Burkholderiaceae bacterium]